MKPPETRPGLRLTEERASAARKEGGDAASVRRRASARQAVPRVLAVVADLETRKFLQHAINRCGMALDMVDNGVAAVATARSRHPDLIVMDLQLRDSTGPEVIQWLRSNPALASTPIILLTTDARDTSRSKSWSVDAVLLKPVSSEAIENAVRTAVGPGVPG